VEYRKWQSGNFQSWSTQDSRETRTIDGMNWYQPTVQHAQTFWGGRTNLHPTSVIGKKGFFRVATCEGRSFLLDPDEGAFLIHGMYDQVLHRLNSKLCSESLAVWFDGVKKPVHCFRSIILIISPMVQSG